ncbi:DUF4825 domain-containing protein [Clostridium tarantellae]|uniref:DUF4825 domain-containing protein n=1 Tax=Clostridium tarantellae TaxID=39493 RepID=A0A6I1MR17_9CLOT|nr:DUF4825 domain-containing protein [Clostridium tarantellae]MPQ45233.1 DUF4825 domain-containing protein [Clostridium tarantellae]
MKLIRVKLIVPLIIFLLSFSIISCEKQIKPNKNINESNINIKNLLEYKDCNIGDNSAVGNIILNLPANLYSDGFKLQTDYEPYELTINYKDFNDVQIKFQDNSSVTLPFEDVIKKNALIIFSLVKNCHIINFKFPKGITITYKKDELLDAHKEYYGDNFEKIISDTESLKSFIELPIK